MHTHSNPPTDRKGRARKVRIAHVFAANDEVAVASARPRMTPQARYGESTVDVESVIAGSVALMAFCLTSVLFVSVLTGGGLA